MSFDPENVNLTSADPAEVVCYLQLGSNEYDGRLGQRVAALFVILVVSTAGTFFPVIAVKMPKLRIPHYVYLFARYFGAGVIIATAFVHLMDPAYGEIGPDSCVGMTGNWASYSWPPAIILVSVMSIFLMDFAAERYVAKKYDLHHEPQCSHDGIEGAITAGHGHLHSADQEVQDAPKDTLDSYYPTESLDKDSIAQEKEAMAVERSFRQQIAAFLILEFGVIFHSVIIGLTLGTAGDEFSTLFPVIVFHQTFEGLGIGARLSTIPLPPSFKWLPWVLCGAYGLTTPIAIAVGLGVRHTYSDSTFTANIVSGVLDSISAGILIYTGLVELLARDFLFNSNRMNDSNGRLTFMIVCTLLGAGVMALLGKWA